MPNERVVERQRVFKQYKEDVKERGKTFFPYAMLHDTIMSLVVVVVIIALAVIWKFTTPTDPGRPTTASTGTVLGLAREAATTSRPTRGRSASSRGPTGTSTSSSTCSGSSSGRSR